MTALVGSRFLPDVVVELAMRRSPLLFAMTLALAACGDSDPVVERVGPTMAAPAPTTLAGVDLTQPIRALGTEPFWGVDLNGRDMVLTGVDRPELRLAQPRPLVQGTIAIYEAETEDGREMKVTLTATECSDGMSDRTYPLSAIVEVEDETLTGCAASTAALMQAPESGPVQPAAAPPPQPAA